MHRQYCIIAVRGIDSFGHLFKSANSMQNAKNFLTDETDFFKFFMKKFQQAGRERQRKLAYLKSVLNDAAVNYPDANYVLGRWRGHGRIGYDDFKEIERKSLESTVENCFQEDAKGKMQHVLTENLPEVLHSIRESASKPSTVLKLNTSPYDLSIGTKRAFASRPSGIISKKSKSSRDSVE